MSAAEQKEQLHPAHDPFQQISCDGQPFQPVHSRTSFTTHSPPSMTPPVAPFPLPAPLPLAPPLPPTPPVPPTADGWRPPLPAVPLPVLAVLPPHALPSANAAATSNPAAELRTTTTMARA